MTSNDVPAPAFGPGAGRRRALGRGPGAAPAEPRSESVARAEPLAEETPAEAETPARAETPAQAGTPAGPGRPSHPPAPGGTTAHDGREPREAPAAGEPGPAAAEPAAPRPEPVAPAPEPAAPEPEPAAPEPEFAGTGPAEPGPTGSDEPEPAGSGPAEPVAPGPADSRPGPPAPGSAEPGAPSDGVFKVRLSNFEGPFDLLLQLISRHKLDVTEVALSKVTDEFMAHIRAMGPDWDLDQTTEFLVVAATLLDLKAARLLPAADVEDEADLALLEARDLLFARLLQYRAYKQIADIFNRRLDDEARRWPRTVGLEPHHAELLPEVVISIGPEGFAGLAVKAMQPRPKPQVYVDHIHAPLVSVREQAGIVVARLRELGEASFRVLIEDTDDTLTVVARFLALLELYREKAVALEQEAALGDLTVRWTGGDGDTAPVVTDEFDRPPERPERPEKPERPEEEERKA
ncbi:segregation and condensation protein A [Streptomyces echinatus]|uniref:Segregation and condensation protein A n=1 Tax=Streptomyces echinatus TaxID=67293 RepID=A0A7W9UU89_9ACTN|nr:segregation/condensation protein A [Streptomyces echinatus]MBB5930374.1 segregation and condensation protein A [Streptomyces echinatus]